MINMSHIIKNYTDIHENHDGTNNYDPIDGVEIWVDGSMVQFFRSTEVEGDYDFFDNDGELIDGEESHEIEVYRVHTICEEAGSYSRPKS